MAKTVKKVPMYVRNVTKSLFYSGENFLKANMPNAVSFAETNSELMNSVVTDLRNYKTIYQQAKTWWSKSSYTGDLQTLKKNAISDLKSGNFYNKERASRVAFENSDWADMFSGFDDFDSDVDFNTTSDTVTTKAINTSTEATVNIMSAVGTTVANTTATSAEFIAKNQQNIASQTMVNNMKIFGQVNNALSDISTTLHGIFDYTKETSKFFDATMKMQEEIKNLNAEISALMKETTEMKRNQYNEYNKSQESKYNKSDTEDFMLGNTLDISQYFKTVFKRAKAEFENSDIGAMMAMSSMGGSNSSALKTLASNPFEFLSNAVFNKMVSKELRSSMKQVDDTLTSFFKSSLLKLGTEIRKKGDSTGNSLYDIIYRVLGINTRVPGQMRTDTYVKGPVPFNGVTNRAIVEVIPTYLRKILAAISNKEEMVYDYEKGTFNTLSNVKKSYDKSIDSSYAGVYSMVNDVQRVTRSLGLNNEIQKQLDNDIKSFFKFVVDNSWFVNPEKDRDKFETYRSSGLDLEGNENSFNVILNALAAKGRPELNKFNNDIIDTTQQRLNAVDELSKTGQLKGFTAIKNGFKSNVLGEDNVKLKTGLFVTDKYDNSLFDYLRTIRNTLLDGIRVYSMGSLTPEDNAKLDERYTKIVDNDNKNMRKLSIDTTDKQYSLSDDKIESQAMMYGSRAYGYLQNVSLSNVGQKELFKRAYDINAGNEPTEPINPILQKIEDSKINKSITGLYDTGKELASVPGRIMKDMLDTLNDSMLTFLYGPEGENDRNGLFDGIMLRVSNLTEKITKTVNERVITPLNGFLFNEKTGLMPRLKGWIIPFTNKLRTSLFDEKIGLIPRLKTSSHNFLFGDGKTTKGLFSSSKNLFLDMKDEFINVIKGTSYTSRETGQMVPAREENMLSIFKSTFDTIKKGFFDIFGKATKTDTFTSIKDKATGILTTYSTRLSNTLFGSSSENVSPSELYNTHIKNRIPRTLLGGTLGLGTALFTPLGLVGGLFAGSSLGFLSTSSRFTNAVFGELGSDRRMKFDNFVDSLKKAAPRMGIGAILGGLSSFVTPFGFVGSSIVGSTLGYLTTSEKIKGWLFGDDKRDGIISEKWQERLKTAYPRALVGAGLGVIGSFFTPLGPVGGAVLGLSLGISSMSEKVKSFLFGDQDPDTNKRQGGLFGQFKLWFKAEVISPFTLFAKSIINEGVHFFKKSMLNPILDALTPIKKEMSLIKDAIFDRIGEMKDAIVDKFNDRVIKPFGETMDKYILDPIKKTFKGLFSGIWNAVKGIVTAPSRAIGSLGESLYQKHSKMGVADYAKDWIASKANRSSETEASYLDKKTKLRSEQDKLKLARNLMRSGNFDINDKATQKGMAWLNMENNKSMTKMADNSDKSTDILGNILDILKDFKDRWKSSKIGKTSSENSSIPTTDIDTSSDNLSSSPFNISIPKFKLANIKKRAFDATANITNSKLPFNISMPNFNIAGIRMPFSNRGGNSYNPDISGGSPFNISMPNFNFSNIRMRNANTNIPNAKMDNATSTIPNTKLDNDTDTTNKIKNNKSIPLLLFDISKYLSLISANRDQYNGVGYNTEMISNILIDQFGYPSKLPGGAKGIVSKAKGLFSSILGTPLKVLGWIAKKPLDIINGLKNIIITPIKAVTKGIFDALTAIPKAVIQIGSEVVKTTVSMIGGVGKAATSIITSIFTALPDVIGLFATALSETTKLIGTAGVELIKGFGTAANTMIKVTGSLVTGFTDLATNIIPMVGKALIGTVSFIGSSIGKIFGGAFSLAKGFISGKGKSTSKSGFTKINEIKLVDKVLVVETVNKVMSLEAINDSRLYEALGNIVTAIHQLRTGTDDQLAIKDNAVKEEAGKNIRDKSAQGIKNVVSDIKDVATKLENKKKAKKKNKPAMTTVTTNAMSVSDDDIDSIVSGNKQVDTFKKKEKMETITKSLSEKNKLEKKSMLANISTNTIIDKVFGKKGIMSLVGTLLLTGLPKLWNFVKNFKNIGMDLLDSLFNKIKSKIFGSSTVTKTALETVENVAEKGGKKVATEVGEAAVEAGAKKGVLSGVGAKVGGVFTKAASKTVTPVVKSVTEKIDTNIIQKILNSSAVRKLAGSKIGSVLGKLATFLTARMKNAGKAIFAKITAKWSAIIGTGAVSGGIIPAIWYGGEILNGISKTNQMFGMSPSYKPSMLMRTIAGFSEFLTDNLTFGIVPASMIANFLGSLLLGDEDKSNISAGQEQLELDYNAYMAETGTEISLDDYNEKIANRSMVGKVWDGTKNTWSSVKSVGSNVVDKIKTVAGSIGNVWDSAVEGTKNLASKVGKYMITNSPLSGFSDDKVRETFGLNENANISIGERIAQSIGSSLSNLTGGLIDDSSIAKATHGAFLYAGDLWDTTKTKMGELRDKSSEAIKWANNKLGSIFGMEDDNGNPLSMTEGIGYNVNNLVEGIEEDASSLWGSVKETMANFKDKAVDAAKWLDGKLGSLFGMEDDNGDSVTLTQGLASNIKKAGTWISNKFSAIKSAPTGAFNSLTSSFQSRSAQQVALQNQPGGSGDEGSTNKYVTAKAGEFGMYRTMTNGGMGEAEMKNGAVYYSQYDEPWASLDYNQATLAQAGCGPTSAAMLLSSVTGQSVTPKDAMEFSLANGHRIVGNGTDWTFFNDIGSKYGVNFTQTADYNALSSALAQGRPAILSGQGAKPFTKGGHFIMAVGMDSNGNVIVNDPSSRDTSKAYPFDQIASTAAQAWISDKALTGGTVTTSDNGTSGSASTTSSGSTDSFTKALSDLASITNGFIQDSIMGNEFNASKWLESDPTSQSSSSSSGTMGGTYGSLVIPDDIAVGTEPLSADVNAYASVFDTAANRYGVDSGVLKAISMQESGGNANANNGYALGLMQIENTLGSEFAQFGQTYDGTSWSLSDRADPNKAIPFAADRLADDLSHYSGDYLKTIQAYNFSKYSLDMLIDKYGSEWRQHTGEMGNINGVGSPYGDKDYIPHVLRYYHNGGSGEEFGNSRKMTNGGMGNPKLGAFFGKYKKMTNGGSGVETTISEPTIDYSSFTSTNDYKLSESINDFLTAKEVASSNGISSSSAFEKLLELIAKIAVNTDTLVGTTQEIKVDTDVIASKDNTAVTSTTQINNKTDNNLGTVTDPFANFASSASSSKVNSAYENAMQIARGVKQ